MKRLRHEDYKLADQLQRKLQGKFSESYAPLGTLFLDFDQKGDPLDYRRELNISEAISRVSYELSGVKYTREYFISYPDQIMVIKLTSGKRGALNFGVRFDSQLKNTVSVEGNMLNVKGSAPAHAEPNYRGNIPDAIVYDENKGTRFSTLVKIRNTDGQLSSKGSVIQLSGGTEALVFVSIATSFNGFDKNPATEGKNAGLLANKQLKNVFSKSFEQLRKSHLERLSEIF